MHRALCTLRATRTTLTPVASAVPFRLCMFFAAIVEFFVWALSPIVTIQPTFTRFRVILAGCSRTFNITRAKTYVSHLLSSRFA